MKLNAVSILFFDCVSKKLILIFQNQLYVQSIRMKDQELATVRQQLFPSVARTPGGIDKEGK